MGGIRHFRHSFKCLKLQPSYFFNNQLSLVDEANAGMGLLFGAIRRFDAQILYFIKQGFITDV